MNKLGKIKVQIKNVHTGEYLYSAADDLAADQCRRRLFTWRDLKDVPNQPGNTWNEEDVWLLETTDDMNPGNIDSNSSVIVRISARSSEYLFLDPSDGKVYLKRGCKIADSNLMTKESSQWLLSLAENKVPADGDEKAVGPVYNLRNVQFGRYLTADEEDFFETNFSVIRRNVFAVNGQISDWNVIVKTKE